MTRFAALCATALALPALTLPATGLAAGLEPPTTTQTEAACPTGQVFDTDSKTCIAPQDARLTDQDRFDAAYDLAHGGRPEDALTILASHGAPSHPDVLTLRGFATRKAGDWAGAVALYEAALAQEPDHWLARAYLGMGLAERGRIAEAQTQLHHIRVSGGRGSSPERQLAQMLATGDSAY